MGCGSTARRMAGSSLLLLTRVGGVGMAMDLKMRMVMDLKMGMVLGCICASRGKTNVDKQGPINTVDA